MSGLAVKLPGRVGTIVVVADRSQSMPMNSETVQKEVIDLIQAAMPSHTGTSDENRLAIVSFGQTAAIEQPPQGTGQKFAGFVNEVGTDESNLAQAIEVALSLIPQSTPSRILILSDGRWTGKDPSNVASRAAAREISIDYRLIERTSANDLAISQVDAPFTVTPGESFMITAWIRAPFQQEMSYELLRTGISESVANETSNTGTQRLASGRRVVPSGLSYLTFRDKATEPGVQHYSLIVSGNDEDPIPENNRAKILIGVQGPRPLLVVTEHADSGLVSLLKAGGLNVKASVPQALTWSLEELSNYSGALIENVSAEKIGVRGMENLAAWVKETGAGFMMTGGKSAYGPGGYFRSPLEPILPVSMELRHEHRKLSLAIVVAMDRSGSMAATVGGGRTKMDLANLAAVQVLDLLSPMDEFGVIAIDSTSHIISDLTPVEKIPQVRNRILRIESEGGGIFIYEALSAATRMLFQAKAGTRHIILFADAADSEEPGKYEELLEKCKQANITVSVIGLGKPTDKDAELLKDIANRGGGRIFFTDDPEELPRLFAQDTFVVARSTFLDDLLVPIQFTGGLITLTGKRFGEGDSETHPTIGGYNLCYLRPGANLAAVAVDEYQAPIIAAWQAGIGRVLTYTGEADGTYTGPIAQWKEVGEFFTSLARWTAGNSENLSGDMLVTQEVKNGMYTIQLHLDPERESRANPGLAPIAELPKVTTLQGVTGTKPIAHRTTMQWTSADTLTAEIPLHGNETALSTVEIAGLGTPLRLSPVALPYSPEFKPEETEEGSLILERLARVTQGRERIDLGGIWKDLPKQPRLIEISPWLLMLAIVLFLIEVLERRTGLLSRSKFRTIRVEADLKPHPASEKQVGPSLSTRGKEQIKAQGSESSLPKQEEKTRMLNALWQARKKARERTDRTN
jgi:Mg-chelatase subunit ChlD